MEPILNYIEKNIKKNGKLNENFTLAPYKKIKDKELNFADGAEDGIMLFHIKIEPDIEVTTYIVELIKKANEDNLEETCIKIDDFYEEKSIKTLPNIDSIIQSIRENVAEIDVNVMLRLAIRIIINTCNVEMMKLGISILGMADMSDNNQIIELVEKIALSDEFTLYANYAIEMWNNANEVRFMLVKKIDGWGKIHLVSTLEPTNENIREWLITNGCLNNVDLGYLAYIVAKKVDLIDVLHRDNLNKKQLEGIDRIMEGLLEEGPCSGIEEFENDIELFESYIEKFKEVMDDINFYHIPIMISRFLAYKEEKSEEEQYILMKIGNLIESDKAISTLKKAILSHNTENFRKALEVVWIDANIELADDIYHVFSKEPFNKYDAFEYLLNMPKYKEKSIYTMENSKKFIDYYEKPEPILWSNDEYHTNLVFIIQILSDYPFVCSNIIAAGLMSKTMQPRNAALNTIKKWKGISKKDIREFPKVIYEALEKLQKTEIIKSYKEELNELLGIQENLNNYNEPKIIMNELIENEKDEINIDLFSEDLEKIFEPQIKLRGKDYFKDNMIYSCIQKENKYIAYVQGTEFGKEYEVEIEMNGTIVKHIKCNCPYQNNCKHEYAMILWLRKEKDKINY